MSTLKTVAPQFIASSAANLYAPPGPEVVRNIHVCNEGSASATFSIWIGATGASAAGTAIFKSVAIAPGAVLDAPYPYKLSATTFVVGLASAASTLTVTITTQLQAD
jgi:hypothetical protein